ncbi:MAG: HAD-IA family hydrolase [Acidobacteriota bacterium]
MVMMLGTGRPESTARIRAVTFDATGTIFRLRRPVGTTYAEVARAHGAAIGGDALQAAFEDLFPRMPPLTFPDASDRELIRRERQWWRELVREVTTRAGGENRSALSEEAFDEIFEEIFEVYADSRGWSAYPETAAVLRSLSSAGLRVGLISNFDSRVESVLAALDLDRWFHTVVHSSRAGVAKPDRAIFEQAVRDLGARAEQTLHVGDDMEDDWDGARAAGLQALLLDRDQCYGEVAGRETIASLTEVLTRLGIPPTPAPHRG